MNRMELHPQVIEEGGRKAFAVLPYQEFERIREALDDLEDLRALREAKASEGKLPGRSLDDVVKDLGL